MYMYNNFTCVHLYSVLKYTLRCRPKQGWLYGMLDDGKIGYFLEDHVTTFIDPIGDIKVKLQTGKAKVTDLPISGPTLVCHDTHWDKNGEKWGKTKEELLRYTCTYIVHVPYFQMVQIAINFVCFAKISIVY